MATRPCIFKLNRVETKLAKFRKIAEIANSILVDAEGFSFIQEALEITTVQQGFELIVDDQLLNLQKKAHALTKVFDDDYDPEGRLCSICDENPCYCTTGEPVRVVRF